MTNIRNRNKRIFLAVVLCLCLPFVAVAEPKREVAVTFDDLPLQGPRLDTTKLKAMTEKLLRSLTTNKVPAFADVNESKLYRNGRLDPALVSILRMWLDAGVELGNHTYSHVDINTTPLAAYKEDVIRGEKVIGELMGEKGMKLRYFRHPVLHTGRDEQTRKALQQFLTERGYTVAPVTIDNQDFMFAEVYARAKRRGNVAVARRVGGDYIRYMEQMFTFFEKESAQVLGYEPKQVLLLHASELNADYMDQLVVMIRSRGYEFISLEEALSDKAYQLPERATAKGLSWVFRWAAGKGMQVTAEPREPQWIAEMFRARAGY